MKKLTLITGFTIMSFFGISQELDVNIQISSSESYDNGTGVLEVNIKGGVAPYYVLWSNGETGSKITGVTRKNYMVRVSDSKGNISEEIIVLKKEVKTKK